MAVGTVSGVNLDDAWQLIATNTPTSGTSTSFTSLSGYKSYMVIWKSVTISDYNYMALRFNDDTTASNYISAYKVNIGSNATGAGIQVTGSATSGKSGVCIISYANSTTGPKLTNAFSDEVDQASPQSTGCWVSTSAITSIKFYTKDGATFSAGTVYLYGIPA